MDVASFLKKIGDVLSERRTSARELDALEFVADGETGLVAAPEPKSIADAFDRLFADRDLAARLGAAGNALIRSEVPRWPDVVARLLD